MLTLRVPIAQCGLAHVRHLDVALRARVHEDVALRWMELRSSDDFRQFLHVHRLDVDDVCRNGAS